MFRRITGLLVLLVLVGTATSVAVAKTTGTKHKLSSTVQLATISMSANFPAVGSTVTDAGIVKAKPGGRGAEIDSLKVTAAPAPGTITLTGTGTLFFTRGTESAKVTLQAVVAADGSATYTGGGKFTKGTGIYKGIRGKFTFTGSSPANSTVTTLQAKGTATY
jgi:hypothetical protein